MTAFSFGLNPRLWLRGVLSFKHSDLITQLHYGKLSLKPVTNPYPLQLFQVQKHELPLLEM